ncbi:exodeoxyribonuclease III [Novispirillum sp. DQ9]|uniref:exodeoxyribonuclease III n=1 Tax=Novispirillum sp. DQ9 TaxID=3398612 RepID=UPI003C7C7DBA
MALTVCTWNVNSIRLRMPHLDRLVEAVAPDVLCLQETKVRDELFPLLELAGHGYTHTALHGMKGYNGVAILSRKPLEDVRTQGWCGREDCRHVSARVDGVEIHNLYVPAGGDLPDAEKNPKFAHKLQFLDDLGDWFAGTYGTRDPLILVGDLNVAPLETDVWDHKRLSRVITHTPIEIARLNRLQSSLRWVDVARRFVPPDEFLFTWWSYRQGPDGADWQRVNRGRRLDHIWATAPVADTATRFEVLAEARAWLPPSDHVPVVATFGG